MSDEVRERFPEFRAPAASHDVPLGPNIDRDDISRAWEKMGKKLRTELKPGAPYNFQDEVCCRPPIGTNSKALQGFRQWLKAERIPPADLGVANLDQAMPRI